MARVVKIDNAHKKKFERIEKSRIENVRIKSVYFLIICEGEKTETNYFKEFVKELPKDTIEIRIEGTGKNTLGLVDYAIKQKENTFRKFDRVWVVFDKDDFPDDNFSNATLKAVANNIKCAWSNEAFELWFLLHFQFVNTPMKRTEYKKFLEREIRKKLNNRSYKYLKNDPNTFSVLKTHGNQKQAISWAKKLRKNFNDQNHASHNPCTLVYELIEELLNPHKNIT